MTEHESNIDFSTLGLDISGYVQKYPIETQRLIFHYLNNLDEMNKKAYQIAYNHLGSSFNILKSNGFMNWKLVLEFLSEADAETKLLLHYDGGYAFHFHHIMESKSFGIWLKNKK